MLRFASLLFVWASFWRVQDVASNVKVPGFHWVHKDKVNLRIRGDVFKVTQDVNNRTRPSTSLKEIVIGLLLPYTFADSVKMSTYKRGEFYASAIDIALEEINKNPDLLAGYRLTYIWNDTKCLESVAINSQYYQLRSKQDKIDVFIGLGCSCNTVARIAGVLNIPIISHVSIKIQERVNSQSLFLSLFVPLKIVSSCCSTDRVGMAGHYFSARILQIIFALHFAGDSLSQKHKR